jgi:hypothetical protein
VSAGLLDLVGDIGEVAKQAAEVIKTDDDERVAIRDDCRREVLPGAAYDSAPLPPCLAATRTNAD